MKIKTDKKKIIFIGDTNSINIEIILKSHSYLKKKLGYVIICNKVDFYKYIRKIKSDLKIHEILDPIKFYDYKKDSINIFNIENKSKLKYENLLNQLNISNQLCQSTGYDLVTMPVDKSIFKKNINFN